ncbi:MAG TPA: helix-turn-helix transcriptional regulator [Streptosporangiaceae bacterium]|jgi:DNA-binding Xre family transcriptional regulator|nr:helix-turn-helix transcriptional regulator [Streptosporangiaceae bacterium]
MTAKLDYRWNLRVLMADRGMFSTTGLRPLLAERGITLSPTQVWRLVAEKPERLNLKILVALMDILGCRMDELVEPVAAAPARRRAAGEKTMGPAAAGGHSAVGTFRPRPARIVPPKK